MIYGVHYEAMEWEAYDGSGSRHRHIARICEHLGVRHFDETARRILSRTIQQAALLHEDLIVPGGDKSLKQAIDFLKRHRRDRGEWLKTDHPGERLDLDGVPDRWWKQVTGLEKRTPEVGRVERRYFEMCVFTLLRSESTRLNSSH